jgi:hypothetical protein
VRSTGDGDPDGSLGDTAMGLELGAIDALTAADDEVPIAESFATIEGVSVGEGELVAKMFAAKPRATAATISSATHRGLDRADCRFIRLHPLFGCLGSRRCRP